MSHSRSRRSTSRLRPSRMGQDGTARLRLRRFESRQMLSGATPDLGSLSLDLSSLPHLQDHAAHVASTVFGTDTIGSLVDQMRQRALAIGESIHEAIDAIHSSMQQAVEVGWPLDPPAAVPKAVHDVAAAIRSQVQTSVSQNRSLADRVRQSFLAFHESIQQAVETGIQQGWTDRSDAPVRTLAQDLASAVRSQAEMALRQSRVLANQIPSQFFVELGQE